MRSLVKTVAAVLAEMQLVAERIDGRRHTGLCAQCLDQRTVTLVSPHQKHTGCPNSTTRMDGAASIANSSLSVDTVAARCLVQGGGRDDDGESRHRE